MRSTLVDPVSPSSEVTTGLALMFLSVMVSPLIDIFAKLAVVTVPSAEVTAGRFIVQALCMLPIVIWRRSFTDFSWRQSLFHAIRGLIITVSMISFVTTLKYMAVADAIAIFFVEPIIVTILGGLFLQETIGWRRYTACGVGFFGAMLIIQPSFEEVGYIALLPVVTALCIAVFVLMTRVLSHREDPWSMQFQMGIWGLLFCAILLFIGEGSGSDLFDPVMPVGSAWFYVAGVGATAAIAGIFGVYAYRAAPASTLAPLQYFEIVSATIFAWLVFGDFPDALKWLGIMIIIASGLYILWRERRFASKPVSDTSEVTLAP
ncbi:DMT family transporter [Rhizobium lentis]|uniref:DMT family transporter n=1 Tax=Rhizobium lentis TaxID=1138194 RepID=A0A9Q3QYN2_9HYPH|nr:DMT family transporter [Rhizobium lentis]MBX4955625.1 DMT family transporter [Rhizobium lentis]MBX4984934.1 DMT family transporter [Rhizobium lentis]MBX5003379.1 DMT family transporter [Rhizobium lentis]MBX5011972.1 DMT family transporter [Rhizobium lentis]MBX5022207.1 DMT family transporter [Rhizobium lentis]